MTQKIKQIIKYILPRFILKLYWFVNKPKALPKILINVNKTNYSKNVLVCHLKSAIVQGVNFKHTAYAECWSICKTFEKLGYNVDVIDYLDVLTKADIENDKYDLYFGQGNSYDSLFGLNIDKPKIYYATGINGKINNIKTLERLNNFFKKNGIILNKSILLTYSKYEMSVRFSDYIFMWGNEWGLNTYKLDFLGSLDHVKSLPSFYYNTIAESELNFEKSGNDFLWMGSNGLLHRGLDIVFDYFINNPQYNLHVLGAVENEVEFYDFYKGKITPNIKIYGFVDISSKTFVEIIKQCSFQIYLSCSEGVSGAVLNGIGNGGLFPILSIESGFSPCLGEYILEESNIDNLSKVIQSISLLSKEEIVIKRRLLHEYVKHNHTRQHFEDKLEIYLKEIV